MILVSPVGKLVRGHVLDVAQAPLEKKLKDYDAKLYLKWNSKKLKGNGVWELRRRPDMKEVVDIIEYQGASFVKIDWHENNFVSHVLDVPYLNYDLLTRLKEMDTWNKGIQAHNVAAQAERNLDYHEAQLKEKHRQEMVYQAKQYKKEFKDLREHLLNGGDASDIAKYWGGK